MVQPIGQQMHILGTGTIDDPAITPDSSHVQLRVASMSNVASSLASVGQLVRWPRINLAVVQHPPDTTTVGESDSESESEENHDSHDEDGVMNYALQVIQLGVLLMQLNDTEKEGDGERCLMNWKLLMLYFRARKRGMKYAFEAMRLITFTKAILTERQAHRVIHGQFVNTKGGVGNNIANDLKMETMVKDHKKVLRGLCGNKTLKAIQRATSASHGLKTITKAIDHESNVPPDSTHHTHASTEELVKEMVKILRKINPFDRRPGRKFVSFMNIPKSPLSKLNVKAFHKWLTSNKKRLADDAFAMLDEVDGDDEIDDEDTDDEDDNEDTDLEVEDEATYRVETTHLS
ncbi:Hypothetical predicted protein [Paramuricea clavata]|uniref:Uncharacterized protein n=1 Tax=Paramuricea clavata TaxID=317549 RepID=A0A7D9EJZ4_PARCT|nr:Hypothetical predicted protein [Paramuricea clavata]